MKGVYIVEQRNLIRQVQKLDFSDLEIRKLVEIFLSLLELIKERKK
jgi:hypothetical protein